jgi:penicillin-binding protein 1A
MAGTARRAQIPGVTAAGKTGTTQAYRDAWFIGYTGNYSTAVWFGNDNYSPTGRVTGGSLPAMTWQTYMEYAHTGIELAPMPGVEFDASASGKIASTAKPGEAKPEGTRPRLLSQQSADVIRGIETLLRDATDLPRPSADQAALNKPADNGKGS